MLPNVPAPKRLALPYLSAIRLKAAKRTRGVTYTLSDVLASLLLAPRTMKGLQLEKTDTNFVKEVAKTQAKLYKTTAASRPSAIESIKLLDSIAARNVSPLYLVFLGGLRDFVNGNDGVEWSEFGSRNTRNSSHELLTWIGDPQIPYFVVMVDLAEDLYHELFLEHDNCSNCKRKERRKVTRHIASILGRWLSPHNARFISQDYWEARDLIRDGAFINKYMNSLSFVTYGATVTLCIRPDKEDAGKKDTDIGKGALDPQEATYGSILRCVELSRLRWHHALGLNRKLDALTKKVIAKDSPGSFEVLVEELADLRAQAATQFLDPLTYLWDATVGADISRFLQLNIIEQIEEECMAKLDMVKQLIGDKRDVLRVREMRQALKSSAAGRQ